MDEDIPFCNGCGATTRISWSMLWGWQCVQCRWVATEKELAGPVTALPWEREAQEAH